MRNDLQTLPSAPAFRCYGTGIFAEGPISPMAAPKSVLAIGNYRPTLTVLRSLARAGYHTIVGIERPNSFVRRSRACHETWTHPPIKDSKRFVSALISFLNTRPDIRFVFPSHQSCIRLIASNAHLLPDHVTSATTNSQLIELCLNKERMFQLAANVGVPVKPFAVVDSTSSVLDALDNIGYPAIVRPTGTHATLLPEGRKAAIITEQAQLQREFTTWGRTQGDLLVQQYAPGPRHSLYFAAKNGKLLASVCVITDRTDRVDGTGYAVEGVSAKPAPEVMAYSQALLSELQYTGIGCIQFLKCSDESFHFMELNPRLGGNSAIAVACGLDLPLLGCELAAGQIPDCPEPSDKPGTRYAWTFGDIHGLLREKARGELSAADTARWIAKAFMAFVRADVHLTWRMSDPLPALAIYWHWLPFRSPTNPLEGA